MQNIISNIIQDKQAIKNQLGTPADIVKVPFRFEETVKVRRLITSVNNNRLDGISLVFGNSTQGIWGTNKWSANATNIILHAILPENNIYIEYFGQTTFINSTSTGIINTSAETYTLTVGQLLESTVIAKLQQPITNVIFSNHANINTNATIQVSNDSGTTWNTITTGVTFSFPTSATSNELKYKITSLQNLVIASPIYISLNQ